MKKFLLALAMLVVMVPSMAWAKDSKPVYAVNTEKVTVGGFKINYPAVAVTNLKSPAAQKAINDDILETIMRGVVPMSQFKAHKLMNHDAAGTVDYTVTCNVKGLLSILLKTTVVLKGDNGKTQTLYLLDGLNYAPTGEKVTSKDLSRLDALAHEPNQFDPDYINAKIAAAQKAGKLSVKKNFKGIKQQDTYNFYFDKDTNVIAIFNPGEVGSVDSAPQTMSLEK